MLRLFDPQTNFSLSVHILNQLKWLLNVTWLLKETGKSNILQVF